MPLRIGKIAYVNCAPIFTSLRELFPCTGYDFVEGVPARLNRMLAQGEIDVCPSSSIEYAQRFSQYYLLPRLSISSFGPVKSVLLFSRLPLEALDGHNICLTAESDTSVNLLKIILAEFLGYTNRFERTTDPLPVALQTSPAALLIGDEALRRNAVAHDLHVFDLGELWWRFTGLPFVFALWIADARAVEEKAEAFSLLKTELMTASDYAAANLERLAASSPDTGWMGVQGLVEYWKTISYDLTPAHLEGVKKFFSLAAKHGLVPQVPEIRILE